MSATGLSYVTVLKDRGVVAVTGPDSEKLLGGLVTNDLSLLEKEPAIYAALLSPQGKVLFDFFVVKAADGYLLDTAREKAGELTKRLALYKLRAQVEIRDVSDRFRVAAVWGEAPMLPAATAGLLAYADPRLPALGFRALVELERAGDGRAALHGADAPAQAYHAHRVALGVPEGGRDFVFGDTFPHEALLDQLKGVSFTKGCYVGQEVVSRMQHRTTVRKRVVPVTGAQDLPEGPLPVMVGEAEIGRLGSVVGVRGLALLKLDRVAEAHRDGLSITSSGIPLSVGVPAFATFRIGLPHETA
jgi:folate-binding protein YgfZ